MKAIERDAGPGDIHGSGIGNVDDTDHAGGAERFPAFGDGAVVGSECGGDFRGRAGEVDDEFSGKILGRKIVEIFLGNLQAVANEDQRRGDLLPAGVGTG